MTPEEFTQEFTVTASDLDEFNHVNNLVYIRWCLDAANAHWTQNTSEEMRQRYIWYVLHHEVHYKASAFLNDLITLKTWVSENQGVRSVRNFEIHHTDSKKLLVHAKTTWCLLDAIKQKPTPIPDEIRNLFLKS